jgi:hypothetical protein
MSTEKEQAQPRYVDLLAWMDAQEKERAGWPWWRRTGHEVWRQIRYEAKHWPSRAVRGLKHAWQRLARGWDNQSAWNLNYALPSMLGAQLIYLGRIAHGYPPDYFGGFDSWTADLTVHGEALIRYGKDSLEDFDDSQLYESAQRALRWVAANLGSIWD